MPALICGSLAFDTITTFPGRFAQQILPEQVHILNVSLPGADAAPRIRRLRRQHRLQPAARSAAQPVVMAAVGRRRRRIPAAARRLGRRHRARRAQIADSYTAQAIIITDTDNNQITAFHPGAMQSAHQTAGAGSATTCASRIIAPDGRDAMLQHAEQLAAGQDPVHLRSGPGPADVRRRRTAPLRRAGELGRAERLRSEDAVRPHRRDAGIDVALAPARRRRHAGRRRLRNLGSRASAPTCRASRPPTVVDPTGCGDAFRAALLYGLERELAAGSAASNSATGSAR